VAGQGGIGPITQFDTNGFDCKIAARSRISTRFLWIEKKELKKMGRFIQVALAAADFAVKSPTGRRKIRTWMKLAFTSHPVIGGFDIIEREHWKLVQGGPGKISPFFIPSAIVNLASGHISIRYGARGPTFRDSHGVLRFSARDWRTPFKIIERGAAENDDLRRHRSDHLRRWRRRIRGHEGAFDAQRRSGAREPAVGCDRDGFVVGEGAGIVILESLGARA